MNNHLNIFVTFLHELNYLLISAKFVYLCSYHGQNVEHPLTWLRSFLRMVESILMPLTSGH